MGGKFIDLTGQKFNMLTVIERAEPKGNNSCLIPHEEGLFIDHINRNRNDNRRENLRICTSEQNSANKSITDKNTSGIVGVSFNKKLKKWCSSISKNNKNIYLGVSENKEVAIKIRLQAEKDYYGEFAPQRHLFEEYGIEQ